MATQTTNLNLTKPVYSETADIAVLNENFDKIDEYAGNNDQEITSIEQEITSTNQVIAKVQDEIGIVINGNKATINVASGQYVIVKNSTITGITDGLYTYSGSTKTAGNSFSSGELTAVSAGGLNALNDKITKHGFKSGVNITSSVSSNDGYIVPADGYINVFHTSNSNDFFWLSINGVTAVSDWSEANSASGSRPSGVEAFSQMLFVRSGMVIKGGGNHWGTTFYELQ